jgi:type I restriction enzyme S subunit
VPIPPTFEQCRIVAEVDRRQSVIEEMEKAIDANLKLAERMRQAILQRRFAGKLVPQNPTYEPAGALLERIRAERAGSPAVPKSKIGSRCPAQLGLL